VASRSRNRTGQASTAAVVGLVVGCALGAGGMYVANTYLGDRPAPPATPGSLPAKTKVAALGRIQPQNGVIPVFGLPGDRITKLPVKQGDKVTTETVIAELASRTDRALERDLVATQLNEARGQRTAIEQAGQAKIAAIDAEIAQLRSGRDSDLKAQDAKIAVLEFQTRQARDNWNRLKSLQRTPVSAQDMEQSELLVRQAEGELTAARALRTKTQTGYEQSDALAQAKRRAAVAELEEAIKRVPVASLADNLKLAERRYEATQIKAPVAGQVLKVIAHEGDPTGTQPIVQIADTDTMVVLAEVYETDIQELDIWLDRGPVTATFTSRALPGEPLRGAVRRDQIARLIAKNQLFSMNPRDDIDRRVVEVRVDVRPESVARATRYVGLEVQVEFQPAAKP
jgi:HlyD family secretion protein